jgi:hypothetical protein
MIGICYTNMPDCGHIGKTCCAEHNTWGLGHYCFDANSSCVDAPEGASAPFKLCVAKDTTTQQPAGGK